MITVPIYPICKGARYFGEHVLTLRCHDGRDIFTTPTPRGGLGSMQASHGPLPMAVSSHNQTAVFFIAECFVPTHSGHHRVNVKKPKLLHEKNIFVVILSLPITSLNKTDLPPDIQTG